MRDAATRSQHAGSLSDFPKLLSHRGRGFGHAEATREAVTSALRSGIRFLELDTRVDAGGVIHARHNVRVRTKFGMTRVRDLTADALSKCGVATLADLLLIVAELLDQSQSLCLDIKDFGFEREHVALVDHFGLGRQTIFVSWIPQALTALHAIAPSRPLFLSHINLSFLPLGAKLVERLLGDHEVRLLDYVLLGPQAVAHPLQHPVGFQHAVFARDLPERLMRCLAASGGGICVPTYCVCDELDDWCVRHSLQQWVYVANDLATYQQLCRRDAIQVIFSDDPLGIATHKS